jgi:hypothetical protein
MADPPSLTGGSIVNLSSVLFMFVKVTAPGALGTLLIGTELRVAAQLVLSVMTPEGSTACTGTLLTAAILA